MAGILMDTGVDWGACISTISFDSGTRGSTLFLSYYRTRSYSSNNSSFLFYLEVILYHWREVNHYNLRHP